MITSSILWPVLKKLPTCVASVPQVQKQVMYGAALNPLVNTFGKNCIANCVISVMLMWLNGQSPQAHCRNKPIQKAEGHYNSKGMA